MVHPLTMPVKADYCRYRLSVNTDRHVKTNVPTKPKVFTITRRPSYQTCFAFIKLRLRHHAFHSSLRTRATNADSGAGGKANDPKPSHSDDSPGLEVETDQLRNQSALDNNIDARIFDLAIPTLATLAADPLASLVSTAWVGRIGAVELAAVGVSLSVYGAFTKLLNSPILAVVTGSTAAAVGKSEGSGGHRQSIEVGKAVSSALLLALGIGLLQAVLLLVLGLGGLTWWGAAPGSILRSPAVDYLTVRGIGAPATVVLLALQGACRGLGDAKTPLLITVLANVINVVLEPIFIFTLGFGVKGAAAAVVTAQAISALTLLWMLSKKVDLTHLGGSSSFEETVQYIKPTGLLALRTVAITAVFATATGTAARTDAVHAAAHQVAFQLWLACSLLADSLAVAAQSLITRSLAEGGPEGRAAGRAVVARVQQLAVYLGVALALGLALGTEVLHLPRIFTSDPGVLHVLAYIMPIVIATQPLNSVAFTLDGVLYGLPGGYAYAAKAMAAAAVPALCIMLAVGAAPMGLDGKVLGVWAGLTAVMVGRVVGLGWPLMKQQPPFDALKE